MPHRAKKRFGQNFLIDPNTISRIVDSIQPMPDDCIVEIGPGLGALTLPVLSRVDHLHVIELDRDVIPALRHNAGTLGEKLTIHEMDVLKFDFERFMHRQAAASCRVIGNLPYNISTPVLFHLLGARSSIRDMHFMLQKEVVDRIAATPGNSTYGRLSVMIQSFFTAIPLFQVSPQAFRPRPRVDSAILRLVPSTRYADRIHDFGAFELLLRTAFSQRRKTLKNTLKPLCDAATLDSAGIDAACRAETVSVEQFITLYEVINSLQAGPKPHTTH